jgi:hypothetical protein
MPKENEFGLAAPANQKPKAIVFLEDKLAPSSDETFLNGLPNQESNEEQILKEKPGI